MPTEVWQWLASSVRKNSGIFKRLYRVSQIWMFEYKDIEGFKLKVKQIVIDYVTKVAAESWELLKANKLFVGTAK